MVITYTISSCSQMVAGFGVVCSLNWAESPTWLIHKAGGWCWLGAPLGLSTGAPVCVLSMWLGLLTMWQLGPKGKCPKSECFKSPGKEMQSILSPASEVTQCHFCHISSVKCKSQNLPDARNREYTEHTWCKVWFIEGAIFGNLTPQVALVRLVLISQLLSRFFFFFF